MNVASSVWHCLRLNRRSIGRLPPQSPAVRKCGKTRTILGVCSGEVVRCLGTAGNRGKRVRHCGVGAVPSSATRSLAATFLMQWSIVVGCDELVGSRLPSSTAMTASTGTPECGRRQLRIEPAVFRRAGARRTVGDNASVFSASLSHPTWRCAKRRCCLRVERPIARLTCGYGVLVSKDQMAKVGGDECRHSQEACGI